GLGGPTERDRGAALPHRRRRRGGPGHGRRHADDRPDAAVRGAGGHGVDGRIAVRGVGREDRLARDRPPRAPATRRMAPRRPPSQLGPELAVGLGSRPVPTRAAALGVGTVLAAVATAMAGPLSFVALLSTPIATALGRGRVSILASALTGAVIVVAADVVASEALSSVDLPTGVVTGALGAPAMLWILLRSRKVA